MGLTSGLYLGYTLGMKTAISLPDELFSLADELAKERGQTRSELYATALREYVEAYRTDNLTTRINEACAQVDTALPPDIASLSRRRLLASEW